MTKILPFGHVASLYPYNQRAVIEPMFRPE
jgi:hypothetical protein